jgi:DNA-binding protein HU-beta
MAAANKAPLSRTDVVSEIAAETQLAPRQVDEVVKALEGSLRRALSSGGEVRMSGFGTFRVSERGARTGRNPQTGEAIKIAASKNVRFSAAKAFKDAIGGGKSAGKGGAAKGGAAKGGAAKVEPRRVEPQKPVLPKVVPQRAEPRKRRPRAVPQRCSQGWS